LPDDGHRSRNRRRAPARSLHPQPRGLDADCTSVQADHLSRNFAAAFNAVTRTAAPSPPRDARVLATELIAHFIDACDSALDLAFDEPGVAELLPGVDVAQPAAMLKAYLLFLATESRAAGGPVPGAVEGWYERVTPMGGRLLGFGERAPAKMMVGLAFSLIGEREHQAPELRALIWLVGDLAGCKLLPGLSS
jgi:hypothetical protein